MRPPASCHVVILDGTMSSMAHGQETNAGLTWKFLREVRARYRMTVWYAPGLQWQRWGNTLDVIAGAGINRLICAAYRHLASVYRPGDRIFLFGYSRGAFAARSLAGWIDRLGLMRPLNATPQRVDALWTHYADDPESAAAQGFATRYCDRRVAVEAVCVWDTVKALGICMPLLWRLVPMQTEFHNHQLGPNIRHGFHALARDERRLVYDPVLWECPPGWNGHVEQVWFRGVHGDIGGHLGGFEAARPLANIPLTWMLERAESCDLPLPRGWRLRLHTDAGAPSIGMNRGWGRLFLRRRDRRVGGDMSESIHPTARNA